MTHFLRRSLVSSSTLLILLFPQAAESLQEQDTPPEKCAAFSSSMPQCIEPYIVVCDQEVECSASSSRYDIRCFACKNEFHDEFALEVDIKAKCKLIRAEVPDCYGDVSKCGTAPSVCGTGNDNNNINNCPVEDYQVCSEPEIDIDAHYSEGDDLLSSSTVFGANHLPQSAGCRVTTSAMTLLGGAVLLLAVYLTD
jgi:hypothetical protein